MRKNYELNGRKKFDERFFFPYLLEKKSIISSVKEEGLFLHLFKTEKPDEKAADLNV